MWISEFLRLAQSYSIYDRRMVEGIRKYRVFWSQHRLKKTGIRVKTRRIEYCVLASVKLGQPLFQFLERKDKMHLVICGDYSYCIDNIEYQTCTLLIGILGKRLRLSAFFHTNFNISQGNDFGNSFLITILDHKRNVLVKQDLRFRLYMR